MKAILEVKNLNVQFEKMNRPVLADVSFKVDTGEVLGIVGESGCGKTTLAKAIIGALPKCGEVKAGSISFGEVDLLNIGTAQRKAIQGNGLGIVTQESLSSLNPVRTIGAQFKQILREKLDVSREEAEKMAVNHLSKVGCQKETLKKFPFQLSGGQRQRVVIAIAFALKPRLLIADEPTTALDVTIQAQVLKEMIMLKNENNTGIILISHNLGVVSQVCDQVMVMYGGKVVESGSCEEVLNNPRHPYTIGLIESVPKVSGRYKKRLYNIPEGNGEVGGGCVFSNRCVKVCNKCLESMPELLAKENGALVACANLS